MSDTLSDTSAAGRFDRAAWVAMAGILLISALVIWRGDQVGLRVLTIAPAPETVGVSPRTQLRVRFDQPLDAATVDAGALALTPNVAGEVRAEGDTLVFAPVAALNPNTVYSVELAPGLQSIHGRVLHDAVRWGFETGHTSIVYSTLDANNKEQLMMAAVAMPAPGDSANVVQLETPQQLTNATDGIWDFAVDGNSGQIVYSLLTAQGTSDLWTLLPGAQEPTLLHSCPEVACSSVAFAPNSLLLAFSQRNASSFGVPVVSPPRLYLLDLAAGTSAPVFADNQKLAFDPRWSPDGQWLSFLSPDLGGVGIYHLENGTERFYPTTTGETATWHPQRNELLLSEMLTGGEYFEVHLILIDPLTETRQDLSVFENPVEDNSPAYSPDGEWVAFRRKELEGPRASLGKQVWLMRADGSEAHPLTQEADFDHGQPTWSPDGRYLLYHRFALRGPDVTISIWVLDVASGQSWEVARPGQRPQWVP